MSFHPKLVVYCILDYFGILFILDINILYLENSYCGIRDFLKDCFVK